MCHYSHKQISVVASYEYPYQCILVAMRYYEILQHCYHMDVVRCLLTKYRESERQISVARSNTGQRLVWKELSLSSR